MLLESYKVPNTSSLQMSPSFISLLSLSLLSFLLSLCPGFGFCEYGDPESTLRALRILHDFKLGDKNLVVKVDSKTRTDLLKYVLKKKHKAEQETVDEAAVSHPPPPLSLSLCSHPLTRAALPPVPTGVHETPGARCAMVTRYLLMSEDISGMS